MLFEILDTEGLAKQLQTSPWTVRHWRYKGIGPKGVRVGKKVLYTWPDVETWLAERAENDPRSSGSSTSRK